MDGTGTGRAADLAAVQDVSATRRRAIVHVATVTAAAGLAMACAPAAGAAAAPRPAAAGDRDVVAQLLAAEQTAFALYRAGLTRFTGDEATSGDRLLPTQPTLARIWQHERSHLAFLSDVAAELGAATPGPIPDFTFADFSAFLRRAAELKHQHVAAYVAAVTALDDLKLRTLAASILAVEARHAAYLNQRIGEAPFWLEREGQRTSANPLIDEVQIAGR